MCTIYRYDILQDWLQCLFPYRLEPTQPREGPLAPNEALNNAQKLYNGKLLGPEAFQLYDGEVYTSLATGEIVKLSPGGHVTFVTKVGQPCSKYFFI